MIRRHMTVMGMFAMLALGMAGCGSPSSDETPAAVNPEDGVAAVATGADDPAGKALTLAVIPKSTGGEFWETVETGARKAASDLSVEIKWEGTLTETEIAEQSKIIENMINLDVDGIALAPLNTRAMRRPVEQAVANNIPVVIFDSGIEGDAHVSFVATDNKAGGALGGQHMVELLGGSGKVVVLRFLQGTGSTEARAEGFIETAKAGGLEIVADPYPEDGAVAGSKKTAANTLEGFIQNGKLMVDGIFACNLYSALGMAAALDDLRKGGIEVNAKFIGFDTSPKLIQYMQEGQVQALVAQNPHKMGYLAVETLVRHLRGETVDALVDTGVELVTPDGIANDPAIRALVGLE